MIFSSGGSEHNIAAVTDDMFGREFFYDAFPVGELLVQCKQIGFMVEKQLLVNKPDGDRDKGHLGLILRKA